MSGESVERGLLGPLIGIVLVFAALGPPIGGSLFVPAAILLNPPVGPDALALSTLAAALFGHTVLMIGAYVVGLGPAAATGFLFALWDAAAPARWPRALVAAILGGAVAYAVLLRLASFGAMIEVTVEGAFDPAAGGWIERAFSSGLEGALAHAFVGCGAIAALACAMLANLLGLTMQPTAAQSEPAGAA